MIEYYLYLNDDYIKVDEKFFMELIGVYSLRFGIWKFNTNGDSYCENEMTLDEPLFYYLRDTDTNKLIHFAKAYKISND